MGKQKKKSNAQAVKELDLKFKKAMKATVELEEFLEQLSCFLGELQTEVVNTMREMLRKMEKLNGHLGGSSTPNHHSKLKTTLNQKVIQFPKIERAVKTPQGKKT